MDQHKQQLSWKSCWWRRSSLLSLSLEAIKWWSELRQRWWAILLQRTHQTPEYGPDTEQGRAGSRLSWPGSPGSWRTSTTQSWWWQPVGALVDPCRAPSLSTNEETGLSWGFLLLCPRVRGQICGDMSDYGWVKTGPFLTITCVTMYQFVPSHACQLVCKISCRKRRFKIREEWSPSWRLNCFIIASDGRYRSLYAHYDYVTLKLHLSCLW